MLRTGRCIFLGLLLAFNYGISALPTPDTTNAENGTVLEAPKNGTETTTERLARLSRCSLTPVSPTLTSDIEEILDNGARLIHMELTILNHTGRFPGEMESNLFNPVRWTGSTGQLRRGKMLPKPTYKIIPFHHLNNEVE